MTESELNKKFMDNRPTPGEILEVAEMVKPPKNCDKDKLVTRENTVKAAAMLAAKSYSAVHRVFNKVRA
jgi:hypothetical protein